MRKILKMFMRRKQKKEEPEESFLICDPSGKTAVVGSAKKYCRICGRDIFVAPSGQELLREKPELVPICTVCGFGKMTEEDHEIAPLQEKQVSELLENGLSREQVVEIADRLGVPVEDHLRR